MTRTLWHEGINVNYMCRKYLRNADSTNLKRAKVTILQKIKDKVI